MNTTSDLNAIRELNMSYLMLARRVLASDRAAAQSHLGLSMDMADLLLKLSPEQTQKLASSSQVLCFFRMSMDMADLLLKLSPEQTQKLASSSQVLCFFRMSTDAMLAGLVARSNEATASTVANDVLLAA
ncbi:flagellar transcriptional regulator FlhD [Caballeronia cordobensis]|uniref:flagellar transcriptional regulator FlhD n=1 Tax=Caballeronia cordobensis TaxID=1353886 RepID=UPI0006AD6ABE|nr:flagellar transcriptional regulator FlhD [Caballeronia cordobensis]